MPAIQLITIKNYIKWNKTYNSRLNVNIHDPPNHVHTIEIQRLDSQYTQYGYETCSTLNVTTVYKGVECRGVLPLISSTYIFFFNFFPIIISFTCVFHLFVAYTGLCVQAKNFNYWKKNQFSFYRAVIRWAYLIC